MKVCVTPSGSLEFEVDEWETKNPNEVITQLQRQLRVAQALWPQLQDWRLVENGRYEMPPLLGEKKDG
jgi:hypothetical protein